MQIKSRDIREDVNERPNDIEESTDISELEDIDAETPNSGLQYVQSTTLEGMVNFFWHLPENSTITEIRITASPAELMWGESERTLEPTSTGYLFDKLVNDIEYTFEIQAYADDETVGEASILNATPYARPFLAIERGLVPNGLTNLIDSKTKRPALGWESLIQPSMSAYTWSPDGTKLVALRTQPDYKCVIFERATREILVQQSGST